MKKILFGFLGLLTLLWAWDVASVDAPSSASLPWLIRQQGMYLTGIWSIGLMSLAIVLATRPPWLEAPLGGMDRVYRLHKWAGILAVSAAALHWLIEMSGDVIKALFGRGGRLPREEAGGVLHALRELAGEMGEWGIYAILAMLALTLWQRFPYKLWRHVHRVMPALYLILAFHAAMLAPAGYWQQPVGTVLAVLLAGGIVAAIISLAGRIGRNRRVTGRIESVTALAGGVTEVACRLDARWRGHRAGQFAFITFDAREGAHPFTIASADHGDRRITFQIKALGDYTRGLAGRLTPDQPVWVEGPYGRFDLARRDPRARQIWIAGGIGVTPFLAWLEALQGKPDAAPSAELHYCTRDRDQDAFVGRLEALAAGLPRVDLHVHDARRGDLLTADALAAAHDTDKVADVWFCGPRGLADSIRQGLRRAWRGRMRFHQEAFEMR